MLNSKHSTYWLFLLALIASGSMTQTLQAAKGELEFQVVDDKTQQPLAARMILRNSKGARQRVSGLPNHGNHFSFVGNVVLELPPGEYQFFLECGLEYLDINGYFIIKSGDKDNKLIEMKRFIDMPKAGWYSGDTFLNRTEYDLENAVMAEDLQVSLNLAWDNQKNPFSGQPLPQTPKLFDNTRLVDVLTGLDSRGGGRLIFANLNDVLPVQNLGQEYPSPLLFQSDIKKSSDSLVIAASPWEWDLPVWVAHDLVDAINVANDALVNRKDLSDNKFSRNAKPAELTGKPRDTTLFPGETGIARWGQTIYFHLLNCGVRIPPSASSGSGVNVNPPGYNRVYVNCEDKFNYPNWINNLKQGKVVVTNGPLIIPSVEGQLPGHVFEYPAGRVKEFEIGLSLSTREKVNYLEVIKNGKIELEVSMDEYRKRGGSLPPLVFDKSGWFLIRAVTQNPDNYHFAMTGPYYVQIGDQPFISKKSALFFYDWIFERLEKIEIENEAQRNEIMELHRQARNFWNDIYSKANAE